MDLSTQDLARKSITPKSNIANIEIDQKGQDLRTTININGQQKTKQVKLLQSKMEKFLKLSTVYPWLLCAVKDVLFSMPFNHINIICDETTQNELDQIIKDIKNILTTTNSKILHYQNQFTAQTSIKTNILAISSHDSPRFKATMEIIKTNTTAKIFHKNADFTYHNEMKIDPKTLPPLNELIEFMIENQIKQVICMNTYSIRLYLEAYQIHLPALLLKFGIFLNIIDFDHYDTFKWGFLEKQIYHCPAFQEYSTCGPHELWDKLLNLKVNYIVVPSTLKNTPYLNTRIKNKIHTIRIFSHCRAVGYTINNISKLLFIFEELNKIEPLNLNQAFQIWFLALSHLIIAGENTNLWQKIFYNRSLHAFGYNASQLIKYIFIQYIEDADLKVEIYGNTEWQWLFPHYYQNKYLNDHEVNQLLDQEDTLNLSFNWCPYGICTPSGHLADLIRNNRLFLLLSIPVLAPEMASLRNIMCSNKEDINQKIKNLEAIYSNKELLKTLEYTKSIFAKNTEDVATSLLKQQTIDSSNSEYSQLREKERNIRIQIINKFTEQHFKLLQHSFDILFTNKAIAFQPEDSHFIDLPVILSLTQEYRRRIKRL